MKFRLLIAASALATTLGCAGLPLPGSGAEPGGAISQNEAQQGAQAHPQMLQEFGGAYTGPGSAYVGQVGQRIAVQSGLANAQSAFTVTLLNSPAENAFAIPGGYVYITRNLVGLMNSEAELASVMGHEVGHVAARHTASRSSTNTISQILAAGVGLLTGSDTIAGLAGQAAQLYTLRYSRQQEYEADELGITYLSRAGYNTLAAADMLASLEAQTNLDAQIAGRDARSVPQWASTHPDPGARVARARQIASQTGGGATGAGQSGRDAFLDAIDGMLYDDDPRQGVIRGNSFLHPDLRLQFTVPQGYTMQNGSAAVVVTGPDGQAQFSGGSHSGSLSSYVDAVFRQLAGNSSLNYGGIRSGTVNGLPTAQATARASSGSSQVDVTVTAYDFGGNRKYHFVTVTRAGQGPGPFSSMLGSVAPLSASAAAAIRPRVIDVVTVQRGDTVSGLARRMAYEDYQEARFRVLNGLGPNDPLQAGQRVKLVIYGG